jgi:hypothetical protein
MGVVGMLPNRRRQLFHARRRFLQGSGLTFCPGGEVRVAGRDLVGTGIDRIGSVTHRPHRSRDARLHLRKAFEEAADLAYAPRGDRLHEPAARNALEVTPYLLERRNHDAPCHRVDRRRSRKQHSENHKAHAAKEIKTPIDRIE